MKQVGAFPMVGRMGGIVGQKCRGGYIFRQYAKPTNPQSDRQTFDRAIFTYLSKRWSAITQPERDLWKTWAGIITAKNPGTTMSAQLEGYSGYTLFMHCNSNIGQTGQTYIDRPPPGFTYKSFTYVTMATAPSQTAAGAFTIDIDFNFADEVQVFSNYGGFKFMSARKIDGRNPAQTRKPGTFRYQMLGGSANPLEVACDTDIVLADLPCTILCQLHFIDQCGLSSGLTDIYEVDLVTGP